MERKSDTYSILAFYKVIAISSSCQMSIKPELEQRKGSFCDASWGWQSGIASFLQRSGTFASGIICFLLSWFTVIFLPYKNKAIICEIIKIVGFILYFITDLQKSTSWQQVSYFCTLQRCCIYSFYFDTANWMGYFNSQLHI